MKKAVKKLVQSDGVSAVAAGIDAFLGGVPVATSTNSIAVQFTSARDALFVRKVTALIEEIENIDGVLLGQAIQNLKDENGENYFNEALFSAIENSDSVKRTKMYGRLLALSAQDPKAKLRFWEVLYVLQTLMISDLELISGLHVNNKIAHASLTSQPRPEHLEISSISRPRERRYRAAGIFVDDMEGQQDEEFVLCKLVLDCVE